MSLGLGTILWAAMFGGSAIRAALTNEECKDNNRYVLPNGIRYYMDRRGSYRLMDDKLIYEREPGQWYCIDTGSVIYDRKVEEKSRLSEIVHNKKYKYVMVECEKTSDPACMNLETGEIIAKISETLLKDGTFEYRKFLFNERAYRDHHLKWPSCYGDYLNDEGTIIDAEEFTAIVTCPLQKDWFSTYYYVERDGEDRGKTNIFRYEILDNQDKMRIKTEKQIGLRWKREGGKDGWHEDDTVYVKDGLVQKAICVDQYGKEFIGYPCLRVAGDNYKPVTISYEEFKVRQKYNDPRDIIYFKKEEDMWGNKER